VAAAVPAPAAGAAARVAAGAAAAVGIGVEAREQSMIRIGRRILVGIFATALLAAAPAPKQLAFPTPDAAVTAFVDAMNANDPARIVAVLGPGTDKLVNSGDEYADHAARERFVASFTAKHELVKNPDGTTTLTIGENDYPVPFPLVEKAGQWRFDSAAGAQEVIDRRVGRNEIAAIRVLLAFAEAQKEYFAKNNTYAQHLVSQEGEQDGLYWQSENGAPDSPLAALAAEAEEQGYPVEITKGRRIPYQGYYYRILKTQGRHAPGGKKDYVAADGKMTGGFALLAWPATYGASGVMTFEVNQDGIAFQKDLGPRTAELGPKITAFDPDLTWARIDIVDQK
jgi:hypothetical protein